MEMQPTDAENAAFVVFMLLVIRVILAFDLNLYIPLSKVDENMKRAHVIDAVNKQKVIYRSNPGNRCMHCFSTPYIALSPLRVRFSRAASPL